MQIILPMMVKTVQIRRLAYNAQKRRSGKYDEALDVQQRRKLAIRMKRNKARIAMGRKRAARKVANMDKLKKRARKQGKNIALYKKLVKGVPKSELSLARKKEIEKRLEKPQMQAKITRASLARHYLKFAKAQNYPKMWWWRVKMIKNFSQYLVEEEREVYFTFGRMNPLLSVTAK